MRYLVSLASLKSILVAISFFELQLPYAIAVLVVLGVSLVSLLALRYYRVKISYINATFHNLTHTIRDQASAVVTSATEGGYKYAFQEFNSSTAENISSLFRKALNNNGITCAIRLAYFLGDKEHYVTVGRSSGLDLSRKDNSQPIPSNEGVARILRQKNQLGILIVKDIKEAIKRNVWFATPNDSLPDIKSVMVAPINGFVNNRKSMVGLLYIGAKKDMFTQFHVDIIRGFADFLGTIYPVITGHVEKEATNV